MSYDFTPAKSDLLWLDAQMAFPAIYREAFFASSTTIQILEFKNTLTKRIRRSGLAVKSIEDHVILINEKIFVWVTRNPVADERPLLKKFMQEKKIARLGYILRLDTVPEWGCVQISSKYLVKEIANPELTGSTQE